MPFKFLTGNKILLLDFFWWLLLTLPLASPGGASYMKFRGLDLPMSSLNEGIKENKESITSNTRHHTIIQELSNLLFCLHCVATTVFNILHLQANIYLIFSNSLRLIALLLLKILLLQGFLFQFFLLLSLLSLPQLKKIIWTRGWQIDARSGIWTHQTFFWFVQLAGWKPLFPMKFSKLWDIAADKEWLRFL